MALAQGQVGDPILTFLDYLHDREPRFHEAGMSAIWNELRLMAEAALAAFTGAMENINLVTDLTPDGGEIAPSTGKYDKNGDRQVNFLTGFIKT